MGVSKKQLLYLTLVLVAECLFTGTATAQLQLCNRSSVSLYSAIVHLEDDTWFSEGWWKQEPGQCVTVLESLTSRYYYIRAEEIDGSHVWEGPQRYCVSSAAFKMPTSQPCGPQADLRGFFQIDTGDYDSFTQDLTCSNCFPSIRAPQAPEYFNVPVVWGSVGQYMCATTGTGDARIAIITCDLQKYQYLPVYWQQYMMAHEHGHVYQVYYKIAFADAAAQEADAECYAGKYLAITNPGTVVAIVGALRAYGGNAAMDLIHGTGNQRAGIIDRCARSVVPNYDANGIKGAIIR